MLFKFPKVKGRNRTGRGSVVDGKALSSGRERKTPLLALAFLRLAGRGDRPEAPHGRAVTWVLSPGKTLWPLFAGPPPTCTAWFPTEELPPSRVHRQLCSCCFPGRIVS